MDNKTDKLNIKLNKQMDDATKDDKKQPPHDDPKANDHPDAPDHGGKPDAPKPDEKPDIDKELTFDDGVVKKIVGLTSADIDGVYTLEGGLIANVADKFRKNEDPTKGVDVDVDDDETVSVKLDVTLKYGESAPEIFDRVTDEICKRVKEMTGLKVSAVKMTVKDMLTDEEIARNEKPDEESKPEPEPKPHPDDAPEPHPA